MQDIPFETVGRYVASIFRLATSLAVSIVLRCHIYATKPPTGLAFQADPLPKHFFISYSFVMLA